MLQPSAPATLSSSVLDLPSPPALSRNPPLLLSNALVRHFVAAMREVIKTMTFSFSVVTNFFPFIYFDHVFLMKVCRSGGDSLASFDTPLFPHSSLPFSLPCLLFSLTLPQITRSLVICPLLEAPLPLSSP